jgi:predicted DNA binding CopG/RHH family protein
MNQDQSYEHDILASFEKGEWLPVKQQAKTNAAYQKMASAALRKDKRVNIRLSAMDLEGIQARAAEEGMPYQTLMASVLHKFVTGRLLDEKGGGKAVKTSRQTRRAA